VQVALALPFEAPRPVQVTEAFAGPAIATEAAKPSPTAKIAKVRFLFILFPNQFAHKGCNVHPIRSG
jgi:hypothetical protein